MHINDIDNETISKAITDAFNFWLSQHDISFPEMIETAIEKSFSDWLMSNDGMERALCDAVSTWLRNHGEDILRDQPKPSSPTPRTVTSTDHD
jgi:hypothetical protein